MIWKFVYEFRSEDAPQIGILNAIIVLFGGEPQTWLFVPFWNNFFLMVVLIWIQTGFAMVILSAALRGVPEDTIEAAIIDGANPWQVFFRVRLPQITSTVIVVWTTITITVLKIFDIVFAMTNGEGGTQVLANYMWNQFTRANDWGIASASAIISCDGSADYGLELVWKSPMTNIARLKNTSPVVGIVVFLLVTLWTIPTLGLLVTSFRTKDQIATSGWWQAPLPTQANQIYRTVALKITEPTTTGLET